MNAASGCGVTPRMCTRRDARRWQTRCKYVTRPRPGNLPEFHRINEAMLAFCREAQDERCEVNVRNMRGEAARVEQNYVLATEMNEKI